MKNWKHWAFMAVIAIVGIIIGFMACDNGNGNKEPQKQTPVVDDYNISGTGEFDYDGTAKTVTITPKENKSTGARTIYYNGSITAPIAINTYSVTFDVAEAEGFNAITGLSAGTITIVTIIKEQPFTIGDVSFIFEYNKYDTTSWAKLDPVIQNYITYATDPLNSNSVHATNITALANREGANYKIIVVYSDEGKNEGFTATDWQTLTVGNEYLENGGKYIDGVLQEPPMRLNRNALRDAFGAMLAKPYP